MPTPQDQTLVHKATFSPYSDPAAPRFTITTWYAGVQIGEKGQSLVKLGYCLEMNGIPVIASKKGEEDYTPSPELAIDGDAALVELMSFLTSEFMVIVLLEKEENAGPSRALAAQRLEAYREHVGPLWDAVLAKFPLIST